MLEFNRGDRDKLSDLIYDILKAGIDDCFVCVQLSNMILEDVISYIQKYFNHKLYEQGQYGYDDVRQVVIKVVVQRLGGMI